MCEITLKNTRDEHYIRAKGHATGSPEACAGVSAILYALGGWLANMGSGNDRLRLEEGDTLIQSTSPGDETTAAFDVAVVGLLQLEKGYPEYIRVKAE